MKFALILLPLLVIATGCSPNGARIGDAAQKPDVAVYPGAKITTNGENNNVIGMTLEIQGDRQPVIEFYAKELGIPVPQLGKSLEGEKNGRHISIIIVPAGQGKTSVSIVEKKL